MESLDREQEDRRGRGIHPFEKLPEAEAYVVMHTDRSRDFGISRVNSRISAINEALSRSSRAPV